jgi:hypothetical protein
MSLHGKWATTALLAVSLGTAAAEPPTPLDAALAGGKPSLDLRLRAEHVDNQSAVQVRDATAATLRARLGYATLPWHGFDAGIEYEGVAAWDKRDYNDGTAASPEAQRPPIADPAGSELNQAWLRYAGIPRLSVQAGRQRLALDNQRFVGNVGWRQNEQTYDGVVLTGKPIDALGLAYAYFHNVNSVAFANVPLAAHLVNVSFAPRPWLQATAYDYRLDFATLTGNRQDGETLGLRFAGTIEITPAVKPLYAAEYARQTAHADAAGTVDADYWLIEAGTMLGPATLKLGYEVLGSNDGLYALQTPLATLHAFNGWADLFLVTPANGLRDAYASAALKLGGATLVAAYHEFSADFGGVDYGSELDASASYGFTPRFGALAKYARYGADGFATDTEKGWLQLEYRI